MRLLEILTLISETLAWICLIAPQLRRLRWSSGILLASFVAAAAQWLIEGPRWQMLPADILAVAFLIVWLLGLVRRRTARGHKIASVSGLALSVILLLSSVTLSALLPVFSLPKPTGPYAIGTTTYHWVDASRPELFTADPNDHREVMAQVWYPAVAEPSAPRAPYVDDADALAPVLSKLFHLPGFFLSHLRYTTSDAVVDAPVAANRPNYPVLIFSSGLDGFRQSNMVQVEALVSQGYIVVGLDQPGAEALVKFPDGHKIAVPPRAQIQPLIAQSVELQSPTPTLGGQVMNRGIIPYFAQDMSFALDQLTAINGADPTHVLTGRIDLAEAGAFGISLGGMNVAEACHNDPRFKACLIMDVNLSSDVVAGGLKQPTMFLSRDAAMMRLERQKSGGWSEHDIALTINTMKEVYGKLTAAGYYLDINGMFHVNFTDAPAWSPIMPQLGFAGPINGQRGFDIVNAYSVAFFDRELRGSAPSLLTGSAPPYQEVNFQSRNQ